MNIYETIIIFDDHYKALEEEIERLAHLLQTYSPYKKVKKELQGVKKLAYEVKGHKSGFYVIFTWMGTPEQVVELERQLRINDMVLKFMSVKLDECTQLEDSDDCPESEQYYNPNTQVDAIDVLLGLADYTRKEEVK